MMKRPLKLIEIVFPGSNSVGGTIFKECGIEVYGNLNNYCWMIMVRDTARDMIDDECKLLGLEEYVIFDRDRITIKNEGKPSKKYA